MENATQVLNETFKNDVHTGLSANSKFLASKYFYDKIGDALFVKIMNMPEYYLTRAEYDIFKNKTQDLITKLNLNQDTDFDLIELGAGDGTKTKALLKVLSAQQYQYTYTPIDISKNALTHLERQLAVELPEVKVHPKEGDYFNVLETIKSSTKPKVILFLGSNIGNLKDNEAAYFMEKLSASINSKDKIVLGVDLIKSEALVLPAYNDAQGITRQFNLNILQRINNELDANFDLEAFTHDPEYTEAEGIAKSYLKSRKAQDVHIKTLNKTFHFKKDERIHTEISRKYNDSILHAIIKDTSLVVLDKLTDRNAYFADYILEKV